MAKTRWGILGTGTIARTLAKQLTDSPAGTLQAVGSRSRERADAFAAEFDVPRACGSYDAVLADEAVDAVYVALPNHLHARYTIAAAEAGKGVLCEKPLAMHAAEARTMVEACRLHRVFLMEAAMYRCHPQTARLVELIRGGEIGPVHHIHAVFTTPMSLHKTEDIRRVPEYGGGAIMDLGMYTMSMARLLAGAAQGLEGPAEPIDLHAAGRLGPTGVDDWATAVCRFDRDVTATLLCGTRMTLEDRLTIYGERATVDVRTPWWPGERSTIELKPAEGEPRAAEITADRSSHGEEVELVHRCLARGDRQAPPPAMTPDDSIGNMAALDRWRHAIGLRFPGE
jgi:predicted dehydrogenase